MQILQQLKYAVGLPKKNDLSYLQVAAIGTNRNVVQYSSLTWGLSIAVPTGANSLVTCTVPVVAGRELESMY